LLVLGVVFLESGDIFEKLAESNLVEARDYGVEVLAVDGIAIDEQA
jgi:hypothetical protein